MGRFVTITKFARPKLPYRSHGRIDWDPWRTLVSRRIKTKRHIKWWLKFDRDTEELLTSLPTGHRVYNMTKAWRQKNPTTHR